MKIIGLMATEKEEAQKIVEKVQKKAEKLNVEKPVFEFSENYNKIIEMDDEGTTKKYSFEVFDIYVKFQEKFQLNDYEIIAKLDFPQNDYIKMNIDQDYDFDFEKALNDSLCEHCNINRRRTEMWILRNKKTNEFKKIGTSCVKEYTGINPSSYFSVINNVIKAMNKLNESVYDDYEEVGSVKSELKDYRVYDIDKVITIAYNILKNDNYQYVKNEYFEYSNTRSNPGESTSDKVKEEMDSNINNIQPDKELYNDAINYFSTYRDEEYKELISNNPENHKIEFIEKIRDLQNRKRIYAREAGLVAYATYTYIQYLISKNQKDSEFIGNEGEKVNFDNVEVNDVKIISTDFGDSNLYIMSDSEGNKLVKFGKINERFIIDESYTIGKGTKLKFKAQIKQHKTYNHEKQTVLGRLSNYK